MASEMITLLAVPDLTGADRIISFSQEDEEFILGHKPGEKTCSYDIHSPREVDSLANALKLTHSGKDLLGQSGAMKLSAALRKFVTDRAWENKRKLDSAIERFAEIARAANIPEFEEALP